MECKEAEGRPESLKELEAPHPVAVLESEVAYEAAPCIFLFSHKRSAWHVHLK